MGSSLISVLVAFLLLPGCTGSLGDSNAPSDGQVGDSSSGSDGAASDGGDVASPGDTTAGDNAAGDTAAGDGGDAPPGDSAGALFEGYGSLTRGAASSPTGFTTYHVTQLADDGSAGTLRDAVSAGSRHIVFDLGGTITLDSRLKIEQDYLTLDGLSAPSPGITITHRVGEYHGMLIDGQLRHTHDVVIQGLRFRGVYDVDPVHVVGRAIFTADADCRSAGCSGGISNLVIDRITLAYASDKFTLWGKVRDVTVSNSFFYGSNKAFLISFYGEPYDLIKEKISVHHNLFAKNEERSPQLVAWVTDLDFRNNIIYDWSPYGMRIKSVNVGDRGTHNIDANIINNVFVPGSGTPSAALVYLSDNPTSCSQQGDVVAGSGMGSLWVEGNQLPPENCDQYSTESQARSVPAYARVTLHSAAQLCTEVTPVAGAPYRTTEEVTLVNEVRTVSGCP